MQLGLGAMATRLGREERLTLARQLGIPNIIIHTPELRGDGYWDFQDLVLSAHAGGIVWAASSTPSRTCRATSRTRCAWARPVATSSSRISKDDPQHGPRGHPLPGL